MTRQRIQISNLFDIPLPLGPLLLETPQLILISLPFPRRQESYNRTISHNFNKTTVPPFFRGTTLWNNA
jgi:hypothetical protein